MSVSPGSESTHNTMAMSPGSPGESENEHEHEHEHDNENENDNETRPQDLQPPQKRKGGRKPIYATSEERKQRNRQAQAAFRERRTEYIKQLEINIKQNEDSINALRQSQRTAADECHMLRYHNSMLERILVEKGYDVQAEMQARGVNSAPRAQHAGPSSPGAPIMQQAIMNRHQQAQRNTPSISTPLEPDYANSSLQSLRISPTSAASNHTPSSSRYSSPVSGYHALPVADHRGSTNVPANNPRHAQHGQHSLPQSYNYPGFPVVTQAQESRTGSETQSNPMDNLYGVYGGGYHTPTSMDESQPSRPTSMAQSSIGKLNSAPYGYTI